MTIRELMAEKLGECGMMPPQVSAVMAEAESAPLLGSMARRWNDETTGYASSVLTITWLGVRRIAAAWTEANCPEAWFRQVLG